MTNVLELGDSGGQVAPNFWPDANVYTEDTGEVEEYDAVLLVHSLQEVPTERVEDTLAWVNSIMKPGGELYVMVPDLVWSAQQIVAQEDVNIYVMMSLFGGHGKTHQTAFTMPMLRTAVDNAGFHVREARTGPYVIQYDGNWQEGRQLYVKAVLPTEEEVVDAPVADDE